MGERREQLATQLKPCPSRPIWRILDADTEAAVTAMIIIRYIPIMIQRWWRSCDDPNSGLQFAELGLVGCGGTQWIESSHAAVPKPCLRLPGCGLRCVGCARNSSAAPLLLDPLPANRLNRPKVARLQRSIPPPKSHLFVWRRIAIAVFGFTVTRTRILWCFLGCWPSAEGHSPNSFL